MYFAKYIHWNASSEFSRLWRAEWVCFKGRQLFLSSKHYKCSRLRRARCPIVRLVPSTSDGNHQNFDSQPIPSWFPAPVLGTIWMLTPSRSHLTPSISTNFPALVLGTRSWERSHLDVSVVLGTLTLVLGFPALVLGMNTPTVNVWSVLVNPWVPKLFF